MIFKTKNQIFYVKFGLKGLIFLNESTNTTVNEDLNFLVYCGLVSLQPDITFDDVKEIISTNDLTNFKKPNFIPSLLEIQELYSKAIGEMGMALADFYAMTPEEIDLAYDGYIRRKELEGNLIKLAVLESLNGNGQTIKISEEKEYQVGSLVERENTLKELKIQDWRFY